MSVFFRVSTVRVRFITVVRRSAYPSAVCRAHGSLFRANLRSDLSAALSRALIPRRVTGLAVLATKISLARRFSIKKIIVTITFHIVNQIFMPVAVHLTITNDFQSRTLVLRLAEADRTAEKFRLATPRVAKVSSICLEIGSVRPSVRKPKFPRVEEVPRLDGPIGCSLTQPATIRLILADSEFP